MRVIDALLQCEGTVAFRTKEIQRLTFMHSRRISFLSEKGLIRPGLQDSAGPGTKRVYSQRDVGKIMLVQGLLDDWGLSYEKVGSHSQAIDKLFAEELDDPELLHLIDGTYAYISSSSGETTPVYKQGKIKQIAEDLKPVYHLKIKLKKVVKPLVKALKERAR